jgi:hypothetical protein
MMDEQRVVKRGGCRALRVAVFALLVAAAHLSCLSDSPPLADVSAPPSDSAPLGDLVSVREAGGTADDCHGDATDGAISDADIVSGVWADGSADVTAISDAGDSGHGGDDVREVDADSGFTGEEVDADSGFMGDCGSHPGGGDPEPRCIAPHPWSGPPAGFVPPLASGRYVGVIDVEATWTSGPETNECQGEVVIDIDLGASPQVRLTGGCHFEQVSFPGSWHSWGGRHPVVSLTGDVSAEGQLSLSGSVQVHNAGWSSLVAERTPNGGFGGRGHAFCSSSGSAYSYSVRYSFAVDRSEPLGAQHGASAAPGTIPNCYDIESHDDTRDCEVFVHRIGSWHGRCGVDANCNRQWLELAVPPDREGETLAMGVVYQSRTESAGWVGGSQHFYRSISSYVWDACSEHPHHCHHFVLTSVLERDPDPPRDLEFVVFVDVLEDGIVSRRWLSEAGRVFRWMDLRDLAQERRLVTFGIETTVVDREAAVYESRNRCSPQWGEGDLRP